MKIVTHKFKDYQLKADIETLIIGTFNPDATGNSAAYFYGRSRNNLWKLLPIAFGNDSLKGQSLDSKIAFSEKYKIGFIDLISSVSVEEGQESNYNDDYLDSRVLEWTDILTQLENLPHIKRVCFTRKTVSGIPKMKQKIVEIEQYCKAKNIKFTFLVTPARFYNFHKQEIWNEFFGS